MTKTPPRFHAIPADLRSVDEMMYHYGEWARQRFHVSTCGSMERRYKSPEWEGDQPRQVLLATWRAVDVQRVVQTLPLLERMCLWSQYRADDHGFAERYCNGHGLRNRHAWHSCQVRGLQMLKNRLQATPIL